MNSSFKKLARLIKKAKSVAIFTHISPDCDALGSSVPLMLAIRELNKRADVYVEDELTYSEKLIFDKNLIKSGPCNPGEYDLMISTDVPKIKRLGTYGKTFVSFQNRIVLDHHKNEDTIGDYYYINTELSSCSEISYEIIKALKVKITKQMATYLYAGLSSDTYSFMNTNVSKNSFRVALELLNFCIDIDDINEKLYKTKTEKEVVLTGYLWSNFVVENDLAYCLIDYTTLTKLDASKADCDSFSPELLCIDGVNKSFSLIETEPGSFNLSLRCKKNGDVRVVAEKLGGGGHLGASGAKFNAKNIKEAKKMVLNAFKN